MLYLAGEALPIEVNGYPQIVLAASHLGVGLFLMSSVVAAQMTTDWLNSELRIFKSIKQTKCGLFFFF